MSGDDKKNPRDNVSPKLKPKEAKTDNAAPAGHLGISQSMMGFETGGVTKVLNMQVEVIVQENEPAPQPELSPEEQRAEYLNNLPKDTTYTALTGNEQQDNESIAQGDVPVTDEEWDQIKEAHSTPDQPQKSYDDMMQSDGSTPFQATNDPEVNQHYKDRGETAVPQSMGFDAPDADGPYNRPRGTLEQLRESFNEAVDRPVETSKSKGPEPS